MEPAITLFVALPTSIVSRGRRSLPPAWLPGRRSPPPRDRWGPGAGTCARPTADAAGTTRVWLRLRAFPAAAGERAGPAGVQARLDRRLTTARAPVRWLR